MPIRRVYSPGIEALGPIAMETGRGNLLRQLQDQLRQADLQYAQLDEGARRYDLGLAANAQQQALDREFGYAQLGQRANQFQQGLAADFYTRQMGVEGQLASQMLQNAGYDSYQQQQTQRAVLGFEAQSARAREAQRFEKAMADREAILGMMKEGRLTPQMQQQAQEIWEQQNGMAWGFPDQMAQQQAEQGVMGRVLPAMRSRLGPLAPNIPDSELQSFVLPDGTVDQEGFDAYVADQQKWQEIAIREQTANKTQNDIANDNVRMSQEVQHEQQMGDLKLQMERQRMLLQAEQAFVKATQAHMASQGKQDASGNPIKAGPVPKREQFVPPWLEAMVMQGAASVAPQQGQQPPQGVANSREEAKPRQQYRAPDGTIRVRGS